MDLKAATAGDWRFWPNLEAATLRVLGAGGAYAEHALPAVKHRALQFRELAPSGGVYTSRDRATLVPAQVLPAGVSPKAGDQVRAADGTDWTVLEVNSQKFGNTLKLVTRNLVLDAGLRDALTVLRPANTQDAAGFRVPGLAAAYAGVPCRLQEQRSGPEGVFDAAADRRELTLFVGQRLVLAAQDVLEVTPAGGGAPQRYDLVGTGNWDRLDMLGEIRVKRVEA